MSDEQKLETSAPPGAVRRVYTPPTIESLGSWRAVTLQEASFGAYLEDGRDLNPGRYA